MPRVTQHGGHWAGIRGWRLVLLGAQGPHSPSAQAVRLASASMSPTWASWGSLRYQDLTLSKVLRSAFWDLQDLTGGLPCNFFPKVMPFPECTGLPGAPGPFSTWVPLTGRPFSSWSTCLHSFFKLRLHILPPQDCSLAQLWLTLLGLGVAVADSVLPLL